MNGLGNLYSDVLPNRTFTSAWDGLVVGGFGDNVTDQEKASYRVFCEGNAAQGTWTDAEGNRARHGQHHHREQREMARREGVERHVQCRIRDGHGFVHPGERHGCRRRRLRVRPVPARRQHGHLHISQQVVRGRVSGPVHEAHEGRGRHGMPRLVHQGPDISLRARSESLHHQQHGVYPGASAGGAGRRRDAVAGGRRRHRHHRRFGTTCRKAPTRVPKTSSPCT